jgi:hypothetical protein
MFERLTADKVYLNSIRFGIQVNFPPHCGHEKAKEVDDFVKNVFDRLAAYEDSGLSPEEVQELAKAKADGRLVVLPCKVGDTVYHRSGQHTIDDIQLFYPRQNGHVPEERIGKLQIRLGSLNYAGLQTFATYADEIGKTVFLSREAAEKALGGRE